MYQQMFADLGLLNTQTNNKTHHKSKSVTSKQVLDNNFDKIVQFLNEHDEKNLKLTCQSFYYYFVTAEIWKGLKQSVAERKIEDYYESYEFEETEPKNITRKDKNIRIHSLKKNTLASNSMNTTSILNSDPSKQDKIIKKRQASNIKEKGKAIMANNQLLMRNTEIGFKRLLHGNHTTKNMRPGIRNIFPKKVMPVEQQQQHQQYYQPTIDNLELPTDLNNYLINTKDPWSTNMQRAQNLIALIKKWNNFHHQLILTIKKNYSSLPQLVNKLTAINQNIEYYTQKFVTHPLYGPLANSISGAQNNLLIDDQLNRVSRLFLNYHQQTISLSQEIDPFCRMFSEQNIRKSLLKMMKNKEQLEEDAVKYVEMFGALQEIADTCVNASQKYPTLAKLICPTVISILYSCYEDKLSMAIRIQSQNKPLLEKIKSTQNSKQTCMDNISYCDLVLAPNYFQILIQISISSTNKLLKLNELNQDSADNLAKQKQFIISLVINKLKSTKTILHGLWNISKYFNKLLKQINTKSNNSKKDASKIEAILSFFCLYYEDRKQLYTVKNASKIQKELAKFKQQISILKDKMGTN